MQEVQRTELDTAFPKKYLQKLNKFRKRHESLSTKPKKQRKPTGSPEVFSSHCKQAISVAKAKVYCCALKELVEGSTCKGCPCHEPEPLEYTLFKRE